MPEYIEREKVLSKAAPVEGCFSDMISAYDVVMLPAADVVPVRHGRWVDNHCTACGMMPMGDEMWKLCDFEPPRFEKFMDYCPNCGAKMDGGVENKTN